MDRTALKVSSVHDRPEVVPSHGVDINGEVLVLIQLSNNSDIVSSDEAEASVDLLHGCVW